MVTPELESYVRACLSAKMSTPLIENTLRDAGWDVEDIHDVFSVVGANVRTGQKSESSVRKSSKTAVVLHTLVYSLLLAVIVGLGYTAHGLSQNQIDLRQTNDQEVQKFFSKLTPAQISFEDTGKMIFPDEQKFIAQRDLYVNSKQNFVEADLRAMQLTLYENGAPSTTVKILTKGKERGWWETPTGNYSVLSKSPSGYSSIGNVWMPYSIQFYGNYLIHGWPYFEDGTPVPQGYSGGCIRLATEDARLVFNFVKVGTPVLVLEDSREPEVSLFEVQTMSSTPPATQSKAFIVSNPANGKVLLEKNAQEKLPIASLTKLMTALVAHETIYLGRAITVQNEMLANATSAFEPGLGKKYMGLDLLYPLLMQSSNETADILARSVGEETFMANMNIKATSLGMSDTHFADPSGISAENISSPADIVKLLQYIYYKRPFIFDITKGIPFERVGAIKIGSTVAIQDLKNYNEFVDDPTLVGVKNGQTTAAKETMATVWNIPTAQGTVPIAIVVLGSDDRESDTRLLIEWVRENYMNKENLNPPLLSERE